MQIKFIVQQRSIKPNEERFNLSIRDKTSKLPTLKTQQLELENSDLVENIKNKWGIFFL
jgi:hypothetical protein